MVRLEDVDLEAGLQNGQPVLRRVYTDIGISCKVGEIEKLSRSGCTGLQESKEHSFIADLSQVLHIPLEIGLEVRTVEQISVLCRTGDQGGKACFCGETSRH